MFCTYEFLIFPSQSHGQKFVADVSIQAMLRGSRIFGHNISQMLKM
jgi:hypothetical protein